MSYFESNGWKQDYSNLLKSLLLISKRLGELTEEVALTRKLLQPTSNSSQDKLYHPDKPSQNNYTD